MTSAGLGRRSFIVLSLRRALPALWHEVQSSWAAADPVNDSCIDLRPGRLTEPVSGNTASGNGYGTRDLSGLGISVASPGEPPSTAGVCLPGPRLRRSWRVLALPGRGSRRCKSRPEAHRLRTPTDETRPGRPSPDQRS